VALVRLRRRNHRADRLTLALAGGAVATAGTVLVGEVARLARRRVRERPSPPKATRGARR